MSKNKIDMSKKTNYRICISCIEQTKYISRVNHSSAITINQARKLVLDFYGPFCACCKENEMHFLDIDHVNNDGAFHRKEIGKDLCIWMVENSFQTNELVNKRFQVLCSNCNQGKRRNGGICPHKNSNNKII